MKKFLSHAEKFADEYPEEALNNLRKFGEAIVEEISKKNGVDVSKVKKIHQHKVKFQNIEKFLPARVYYYLEHIQKMGNYGSHLQEDGVDPSPQDSNYCLYAAKEVYRAIYPQEEFNHRIFITEIEGAVPCEQCSQEIGEFCIKADGSPAVIQHTTRIKEYTKYRRDVQKSYNTTIKIAMRNMVEDIKLSRDQVLTRQDILEWFANHYPAYSENAISSHIYLMCVNLKARESHNISIDEDIDLFWKQENGQYILYHGQDK
jgi:hypothetical protein